MYYVYILASKKNGTLYIGITNDLNNRLLAHKAGKFSAFTRKYNIKILVYVENFATSAEAIMREKHLKHWRRAWKIQLIEKINPYWNDLSLGSSLDPRKSGDDEYRKQP